LEFRYHATEGTFRIHSQTGTSRAWNSHCAGMIRSAADAKIPEPVVLQEIQARCTEETPGSACYERFQKNGFHFGESFRGISRVWRRDGEALGAICAPETLKTEEYLIHPALLDSCFQVLLSTLTTQESARGLFLPVQIGRLRFFAQPKGKIWSHVRLLESDERTVTANIRLLDQDGGVLAVIDKFRCTAIHQPLVKPGKTDNCFYEIAWREEGRETSPSVPEGWQFVGEETSLTREVASQLTSAGDSCTRMDFARLPASGKDEHIVYFSHTTGEGNADSANAACVELLELVQKLAADGTTHRLTVVTRCAQPVDDGPVSPAEGALVALARVIMNEQAEMNCRVIDLGPEESPLAIESLLAELRHGSEEEVALRDTRRFVPRLVRTSPKLKCLMGANTPFRLEVVKPGVLDHLEFHTITRTAPKAGEVEIEVCAAGLNFRDVMKGLGIYPIEQPADHLLGDECAGRVVAVGEGVAHLREGDEVIAISPGCFSKFITVPAAFAVRKPAGLSFEEAVTIPVTFLTAQYALHHLGRIERGERILIHAAAGGVGLAALQIARLAGAEIFATAGNDEKRALVKSLGAAHVMDSRSLDFAEEVMEITNGRGVDLVLNSLAGEAIPKSLSVLAPYGRFLEIGKRDIYQNSRLGLRPFSRNLSFFAMDLSQLLRDRQTFIGQMFGKLMQQFEARDLVPLPHKIYPVARAADAFREMAAGKHIGKIVFSLAGNVPVQPAQDEPVIFRGDATYLIAGGVGGFGLTVAEWMISHGARNLVLIGSRDASVESARKRLADAESQGVRILAKVTDVSDETALDRLFSEIRETMPPLLGVIQAAMKIDDGVLQQLNAERFRAVMAPKAGGAWNLHVRTREMPLSFFVMFSSIASLIGNPGQGNYAAANGFLDGLASYRHSLGLPALTVNWGHLGGVGYVSRHAHVSEYLHRHGLPALAPPEALDLLGRLLRSEVTRTTAMRMDWEHWAQANPRLKKSPRFREIISYEISDTPQDGSQGGIAAAIRIVSGPERLKLLETFIREMAARVLGMPVSKLDTAQPLTDFGLDSLMSIELVNRLEEGLQFRFPVEKIVGGPSILALAKILAESLPTPPATC